MYIMKWKAKPGDDEIASVRLTKRTRLKLGFVTNNNETLNQGLESILDNIIKDMPEK